MTYTYEQVAGPDRTFEVPAEKIVIFSTSKAIERAYNGPGELTIGPDAAIYQGNNENMIVIPAGEWRAVTIGSKCNE
jgi:hypothetical protein